MSALERHGVVLPRLLRHLEELLGRKVDLVIEEAIKPAIRGRILAEKIDVPLD